MNKDLLIAQLRAELSWRLAPNANNPAFQAFYELERERNPLFINPLGSNQAEYKHLFEPLPDSKLSYRERVWIAGKFYGAYTFGLAVDPREITDELCAMDNMKVPFLREQLTDGMLEYINKVNINRQNNECIAANGEDDA
jgi:hypothetical protein